MKDYQVIARRFRPQKFAEVVGQDAVVTTLKNALRFLKIGAAYLFCGTRGTGKTTLARLFAKALNCQQLTPEFEPCNTCSSCLEIASGHSPNVLEIDGASNRGIDDIRQINETVGYVPTSGKYKIYIIDEVHMLTKEAFNALLKTLEEPPPHIKFFFATTEAHKVLPTIISRCQRFDLRPISPLQIKDKLRSIAEALNANVEEEALTLIAAHASGALRDAQSLLDQLICYTEGTVTAQTVTSALGLLPKDLFFKLDQAIHAQNLSFAFECAEAVYATGNEVGHFLEGMMEHIRTLLEVHLKKSASDERTQKSASLYTQEQCLYILDYLMHWHQEMARTPFKRIGLEIILLHLLRSRYRLTPDVLAKRLMAFKETEVIPSTPPPAIPPIPPSPPPQPPLPTSSQPSPEPLPTDSPLPFEKKQPTPPPRTDVNAADPRYETLLRFAAVELEATIKKE